MKDAINTMAQYPAPVLISGETGTGKELVARALHYGGKYASKPFIALNCSTFSDELFISELFGYKKGAFTDAKNDKEGLLVSANGGTIFLDEIDSLSLRSQAALLRVLQESEFRPIGSNIVLKANVRFIAATNCNLEDKIRKDRFRQDLYFRLFILSVNVPALRERTEDIVLLVDYFIQKLNIQYSLNRTGITPRLFENFKIHTWPGNVRELENTIHRHYLMAKGEWLDDEPILVIDKGNANIPTSNNPTPSESTTTSDIFDDKIVSKQGGFQTTQSEPSLLDNFSFDGISFSNAKRQAIENFEAKFVSRVLKYANGNITKAASICGKERRAFGKLVKKYNIKNNEIIIY